MNFMRRIETDDAVFQRKQRKIAALAHETPRREMRALLAHDDAPGPHKLSAEALDSEPLGIGIAAVFGTAQTFFMRHDEWTLF